MEIIVNKKNKKREQLITVGRGVINKGWNRITAISSKIWRPREKGSKGKL